MASVVRSHDAVVQERHGFYVKMATACLLVAVAGFFPTYWMPLAKGTLGAHPLTHLHALLFFGWTVYFLAQTLWVKSGRMEQHRAFGVGGVALATAMLCIGLALTMHSLKTNVADGVPHAKAFAIVSSSGIAFFAATVTIALVNVRRPDVHKRLMVLATVSILQAAVARWFLVALQPPDAIGPPPVHFTIAPGLVIDLLIVWAMVVDWRSRGRPHRVYVIGGASLLALQLLRVPLSETAGWTTIADSLLTLMP